MFKTTLLTFMVIFVLTPHATKADFYKYIDKSGNIVFTDDLSAIPEDQRQKAEKYREAPPSIKVQESNEKSKPELNSKKDQGTPLTTEEMSLKKKELEKKQSELEKEYEILMQEKARLEKQKNEAIGRNKIKAYNEQILRFSERLNKYNEERTTLEKDVNEYNSTLKTINNKTEK